MGSTRLPGKVLMPILDKPILQHITDFLKFSKFTDHLVVATTNLPQDDKIEKLLKYLDIDCYRGNPDDVLERYYECSKLFKGDLIVRITADDPLIDPTIVDEIITICKESGCDYGTNSLHRTFPLGIEAEAITFSTLEKLHETQKDPLSREHVTHHITHNPNLYNIKEVLAPSDLIRPNWRLTLDHIEDYYLISKIFSKLYVPGSYIKYRSVVELLDMDSDLLKINEKYNI